MTKAINHSNYSRPRNLRFANSSSSSTTVAVIVLNACYNEHPDTCYKTHHKIWWRIEALGDMSCEVNDFMIFSRIKICQKLRVGVSPSNPDPSCYIIPPLRAKTWRKMEIQVYWWYPQDGKTNPIRNHCLYIYILPTVLKGPGWLGDNPSSEPIVTVFRAPNSMDLSLQDIG